MYFDNKEVGLRIKQLRKQHGLTQEELAEKVNITENHLYKVEAGQSAGSMDLIVELAECFDVSLDYLVLGKEQPRDVLKTKVLILLKFLTAWVKDL